MTKLLLALALLGLVTGAVPLRRNRNTDLMTVPYSQWECGSMYGSGRNCNGGQDDTLVVDLVNNQLITQVAHLRAVSLTM